MGKPKKRRKDEAIKNLETLDVTWKDKIQNREDWKTLTVASKVLKEPLSQRRMSCGDIVSFSIRKYCKLEKRKKLNFFQIYTD